MPRRTRFRRRRPRRNRRRRGGLSTRRAAFKALSHIDLSVKYIDQIALTQPLSTNPLSIQLNLLAEGTEHFNRIGQGAKMKALACKILFTTVAPGAYNYRVMLVWDKQPNGAAFVPADLLESDPTPLTSHMELANSHRFRVLKQKNVWIDAMSRQTKLISFYARMSLTTRWDGPTSAPGALRSGMLSLVIFSNVANIGDMDVLIQTRLRFVG